MDAQGGSAPPVSWFRAKDVTVTLLGNKFMRVERFELSLATPSR